MIGKIAVKLLAVICFSCILTDADSQLPEFNTKFKSDCNWIGPEEAFSDIEGLGYVLESTGSPLNCLTLDIQPIPNNLNAFTATYSYYNNGSISSQQSIVIQNAANPGEAQSYLKKSDGTFEFQRTAVIVAAALGPNSNVIAYTLLSCNTAEVKQLAIVVKGKPPQSSYLVNDQKEYIYEKELEKVPLTKIDHGSDCAYQQ